MNRKILVTYASKTGSTAEVASAIAQAIAQTLAQVQPQSTAFFGGQIEPARMSFLERLMTKAVKAEIGDFRDWDAIRGWASGLASLPTGA